MMKRSTYVLKLCTIKMSIPHHLDRFAQMPIANDDRVMSLKATYSARKLSGITPPVQLFSLTAPLKGMGIPTEAH